MSDDKKTYLELLLKDRKLKLDHIRDEHIKAIAVFEAKQDMLLKDIDLFEGELDKTK